MGWKSHSVGVQRVPVIVVTGDPLKAKMRAFGRRTPLTILAKPLIPEQFEAALQVAL